jgi:cation:H+ antiporter
MATGAAMAGGLYVLAKAADMLVDNTAALGKKTGISSMALGVALGVLTSLPELVVSLTAMAAGRPDVAISNITGSNTANLLLILGLTATIRNIQTKGMSTKFNTVAMLGATGLLTAQLVMGALNPVIGGIMLASAGLYLWKSMKIAQKDEENAKNAPAPTTPEGIKAAEEKAKRDAEQEAEEKKKPEAKVPKWFNLAWGVAGLGGLIGAATFAVPSAVAFGTAAGVSAAVVGALAVAVGTSLPELMVNVKSALKGDTDLAVGNILGSNVFNVLGIMGAVGLSGTEVPRDLNPKASPLGMLNTVGFGLSAVFAAANLAWTKGKLERKHGVVWLGLYAAFAAAQAVLGGTGAEAAATPAAAALPPPAPKPF